MTDSTTAVGAEAVVTLREITEETVNAILRLSVAESQRNFVATNARSIAQAHFSKHAWFRAIYADETPVGFIMMYDASEEPVYFLWRLMIDERYQSYSFGRRAVELLIDHVRTRPNATELLVSYQPGEGSPKGFYEKLGFAHTGQEHGGEKEMRLTL